MHVWIDLISRELLFTALLTLLGLAPAAWLLPERFGRAARLAVAPVFGMCVGVCLTATTLYVFPADDTGWLVLVVAAVSTGLGVAGLTRARTAWRRPSWTTLAQLGVVVVVVLATFSYPLAARHSVGPVGGYRIADTSGYVSEITGAQRYSIHQADRIHSPVSDLTDGAWALYAQLNQQFDVAPLEANVNGLLGLGAIDTHSPFLIAVILAGALGAFAAVRSVAGAPTWGAPLAGCLFAGPLFVELLMDGSEAAIAGSALLAPIVVVGLEAIRRPRLRTLALMGLLAAGLQTVYPLFVPAVVIGGALTLAVAVVAHVRRAGLDRRALGLGSLKLLFVLALAAGLTPIAFARNVRYWHSLLTGTFLLSGLPPYRLPASVLPGWILQTREFYGLTPLHLASHAQLIGIALVPLLLVGVIAVGAWRHRAVLVILGIAAGGIALAEYSWSRQHCGYCVQREMLPIGALAPTALGIGFCAVVATRRRGARVAAVLVALLGLVLIAREGVVERKRLIDGAYVLDPQLRDAASRIPAASGPVELEGFSESGIQAPMELVLAYNLVDRRTGRGASYPTTVNDGAGLQYFNGPAPLGPSVKPGYRYVLTRLGSIATQRATVARSGPIQLQRRTGALDVTLTGGVSVAPIRNDPTGSAWVSGPLSFLVAGGQSRQPAWISLVMDRTVPVRVLPGDAVSSSRVMGDSVRVCLRVAGNPPVRTAGVQMAFAPRVQPTVGYEDPPPARGLRVVSVRVSSLSCTKHP